MPGGFAGLVCLPGSYTDNVLLAGGMLAYLLCGIRHAAGSTKLSIILVTEPCKVVQENMMLVPLVGRAGMPQQCWSASCSAWWFMRLQ